MIPPLAHPLPALCPRPWPLCWTLSREHIAAHHSAAQINACSLHETRGGWYVDQVAATTLRAALLPGDALRNGMHATQSCVDVIASLFATPVCDDEKSLRIEAAPTARARYTGWRAVAAVQTVVGAAAALLAAALGLLASALVYAVCAPFATLGAAHAKLRLLHDEALFDDEARTRPTEPELRAALADFLKDEQPPPAEADTSTPQTRVVVAQLAAAVRAERVQLELTTQKVAAIDHYWASMPSAATQIANAAADEEVHAELGLSGAAVHLRPQERTLIAHALLQWLGALSHAQQLQLEKLLLPPQQSHFDARVLRQLQGLAESGAHYRALFELAETFTQLHSPTAWRHAWTTLVHLDGKQLADFAGLKVQIDAQLTAFLQSDEAFGISGSQLRATIHRAIASQLARGYERLARGELRVMLNETLQGDGYLAYWLDI